MTSKILNTKSQSPNKHQNTKNLVFSMFSFYLVVSLLNLVFLQPTAAQSPTATDSASQLRDSVKEKVAEELNTIKSATTKKAYVGTITKKEDLTLTLTTIFGQTRTIVISPETTIKLTNSQEGTPASLKEKAFIIAMGDADSTGKLTAKRVVVTAKPLADNRIATFGTVSKLTSTSITIGPDTFKITSTTKSAKVKNGDTVVGVYIGTSATRIYLVSASATPTPSPKTTPSPTSKPTSTLTPTPTP